MRIGDVNIEHHLCKEFCPSAIDLESAEVTCKGNPSPGFAREQQDYYIPPLKSFIFLTAALTALTRNL
jgi:hypothetical protein